MNLYEFALTLGTSLVAIIVYLRTSSRLLRTVPDQRWPLAQTLLVINGVALVGLLFWSILLVWGGRGG